MAKVLRRISFFVALALLLPMLTPPDAYAQGADAYRTETGRWRAAGNGFGGWQLSGVALASNGAMQLDHEGARAESDPYRAGMYRGGNFYNGGSFVVGEAISPAIVTGFPFAEAVPSWNAVTPSGTWVEVLLRVRTGANWTGWYNMGVWAGGSDTVARHSVSGQADSKAYVDVDTLKLGTSSQRATADAYQFKVRLFSQSSTAKPGVNNVGIVVSRQPSTPTSLAAGEPARWNKVLDVPECSQMVYPDGGEVWCSPTSMSMVLAYWARGSSSCETRVRAAVNGVYDRVYRGHGNWSFNAAYAGSLGLEANVSRFTSLAKAEEWIAAGVPVVMSFSWSRGQLTGAPIASSSGHLMVLVGFDKDGNPVVNDPAGPSNTSVQITYNRAELEKLWLQNSGGTVYLIYPRGWDAPLF